MCTHVTDISTGQLEQTIAQSFHRASNLRSFLLKADAPDALKRCQSIFDQLVDPQATGTLMAEINDLSSRVHDGIERDGVERDGVEDSSEDSVPLWNAKNAKAIPHGVRNALYVAFSISATKAMFSSNTKIAGFVHSTEQKHAGNSQILFSKTEDEAPTPGFIQYVFSLEHDTRRFLAVRRLLPATVNDPFSSYPLLGIRMYSNSRDDYEVITSDDVDAQFASCPLEWESTPNIAVISLSRVSYSLTRSVS